MNRCNTEELEFSSTLIEACCEIIHFLHSSDLLVQGMKLVGLKQKQVSSFSSICFKWPFLPSPPSLPLLFPSFYHNALDSTSFLNTTSFMKELNPHLQGELYHLFPDPVVWVMILCLRTTFSSGHLNLFSNRVLLRCWTATTVEVKLSLVMYFFSEWLVETWCIGTQLYSCST